MDARLNMFGNQLALLARVVLLQNNKFLIFHFKRMVDVSIITYFIRFFGIRIRSVFLQSYHQWEQNSNSNYFWEATEKTLLNFQPFWLIWLFLHFKASLLTSKVIMEVGSAQRTVSEISQCKNTTIIWYFKSYSQGKGTLE